VRGSGSRADRSSGVDGRNGIVRVYVPVDDVTTGSYVIAEYESQGMVLAGPLRAHSGKASGFHTPRCEDFRSCLCSNVVEIEWLVFALATESPDRFRFCKSGLLAP
jgi:hypothetical protein